MNILDMELIHPKKKVNRQIYSTPGFYVYIYIDTVYTWNENPDNERVKKYPFIKNKDNHNLQLVQE